VLQAYVDESMEEGAMALGGFVATAEAWGKFSAEWERLLLKDKKFLRGRAAESEWLGRVRGPAASQ
jgi:hypothetical protein